MIGRLAPGANVDDVMPGFEKNTSPIVEAGLLRNSGVGTTVTVANWSVMMGSVPGRVGGSRGGVVLGAGGGVLVGASLVLGAAVGVGLVVCAAGARTGARRTMGLGAVTRTSGSWVWESAAPFDTTAATSPVLPSRTRFQYMNSPHCP
jgi:hypothetical protein